MIESINLVFCMACGEGLRVRFHVDLLSPLASSPLTLFHLPQHDQPHTDEDPHTAPLHYRRNDAMMLNNAYQETRAREPPHSRA